MITVNDLTLSWGAFTLLDHISIHIGDNEKIGLVGKNGAGKSTLLKLILGEVSPTSGTITKTKGERIGYLPQMMSHAKDKTVMEEAMKAFDGLFALHDRIDEITAQLSERTDYQSNAYNNLIVELNNVQDRVAMMESEPPASQAEKVLVGLGFRPEEFNRPTRELSQGWNMRIELAKILLSKLGSAACTSVVVHLIHGVAVMDKDTFPELPVPPAEDELILLLRRSPVASRRNQERRLWLIGLPLKERIY